MILYTDGSCSPNPGPGGFSVMEHKDDEFKPVRLGNEKESTNIRMEGEALIAALQCVGQQLLPRATLGLGTAGLD